MGDPTVAIVTKAKATYWRPVYEAFAHAQPPPWKTLLAWPESDTVHPTESIVPQAANLEVTDVRSRTITLREGEKSTDGRRRMARKDFLPSRALWRLLASRNIRAILIHEYSPYTLQALIFAKWRRIPLVVSSEIGRRNRAYFGVATRMWHTFWGRFANGIVACTPAALDPLSGGKRPITTAYHAMDSRVCVPLQKPRNADSPVVFAYLGQLIHRKGLDLFLQAAARLRSQGVGEFAIRLIGGGDTEWVKGWIRDLRLDGIVEMTGFLTGAAIQQALGNADVFVLPTRQDTYAAVVHEAACMALPLLVSKYAGASEALVENFKDGFVFDPANMDEFAGRMRELMDPDLRLRMGACSRAIAESFSAHRRGAALWEWMHSQFLRQ